MKANQYTYEVQWSPEDGTFVAVALEFRSLAAHGPTQQLALREISAIVADALADMTEDEIPTPFSLRTYSGRLNLRMSRDLHRRLALSAEREGVSLNTLIVSRLASQ